MRWLFLMVLLFTGCILESPMDEWCFEACTRTTSLPTLHATWQGDDLELHMRRCLCHTTHTEETHFFRMEP